MARKSRPMADLTRRGAELLLYETADGRTRVEVRLDGETAWLSLGQMAELFQRDKSVISRHVKNVFEEGELSPEATVAKSAMVQREGDREVTREVESYNLDVIISVGYRVKSHRGTQFLKLSDRDILHHAGRVSHTKRSRRPSSNTTSSQRSVPRFPLRSSGTSRRRCGA